MVSFIIINYKQKKLLYNSIESIHTHIKSAPFEVIIINNSPEEDLKELEKKYKSLHVIPNGNKGFSQANNLGANRTKGEYLFFLNADTIIQNDFLKNLTDKFDGKDFGAIGLKLYNEDGTFQLSFWKENTFFNESKNKKEEDAFKNRDKALMNNIEEECKDVCEVEWVSGAGMLIKKKIFEKIGGFDEDFFLFYEDADICKRLKDAGYKIYFYPFSKITHLKGENVNANFRNKTYFYSKKSQLLYYKKHNGFSDRFLLRLYLVFKFSFLSLFTFRKINLEILAMALGLRSST